MIVDSFMMNDELDMLECRLTELDSVVDAFVIVEADRTHGHNRPKPLHYRENRDRFSAWHDRIVHVIATDLPTEVDAWSREHAQREFVAQGLAQLAPAGDDVILHGDIDEIPDVDFCRFVRPNGFAVNMQTLYCFAVDWQHPDPWHGTVAAYARNIGTFSAMRDARLWQGTTPIEGGWHLSWLGGYAANHRKMASFCHPEIEDEWKPRLGECRTEGIHVDGRKLIPVTVDDTWPKWIAEGHAPKAWFR